MTILNDVALAQVNVLGSTMAYREAGDHDAPVALFLHGNPTSSYLWRNVLSHIASVAHCIAPDLIGFGQSGKPDIQYRVADHARYLDEFLDQAKVDSAFVVAQDWGTALAFLLAARRPEFVRGLAFMEFIKPLPSWDGFAGSAEIFQKFRTPGVGEELILQDNFFVEQILPMTTVRKLTDEEMSVYRAPFPTPESRKPVWRFPNEIPIAGEPADVYSSLEKAHEVLAQSTYPKLLFAGDPGAIVSPAMAQSVVKELKNCRLVQLSSGLHCLQEDHPDVIGANIKEWLLELGVASLPKQKLAL
ncbi:MAG TPA: haloalkane dehalogenase [Chthoniobacterales bacterium]